MKRPEQNLQIECVKWFRMQYPHAIIHHSANGGYRTPVEGKIMKAMGVVAGFPDLMILYKDIVCFVEMKSSKGQLTENQKDCHNKLWVNDFRIFIVKSFDEFKAVADGFIQEAETLSQLWKVN